MKKRFTEEQVIGILRQAEVDGVVIRDLCRKHNITEQTFFRWRNKYGGMNVSEARRPLFGGMHFSNPVPTMKMCEVISTPQTSADTIEAIKGVAEKAGKAAIMVKDQPGSYGFILNRVFAAARREAEAIVDAGLATPEDVDRAMMTGRNWPAGFFGERGGIGKQW